MDENQHQYGGPPSPEITNEFANDQEIENGLEFEVVELMASYILSGSGTSDDPLDLNDLLSGDPEIDSLITSIQHAANGTGPMQNNTPLDHTVATPSRPMEPGEPQTNAMSAQQVPGIDNSEVQSTSDENSGAEERDASGPISSVDGNDGPSASSTTSLKRKREEEDSDHQVEGMSATAGTTGETSFDNCPSPPYREYHGDGNTNQGESQGLIQGHRLDQDTNNQVPKRPRREGSPKPNFHPKKSN